LGPAGATDRSQHGRPAGARRLLEHGTDPDVRDDTHHLTALDWCRKERANYEASVGHDEVEAILAPITAPATGHPATG